MSLEVAIAYQAAATFLLVTAAVAVLPTLGYSLALRLGRRELAGFLLLGTVVATLVGLALNYENKGAWLRLYNGWIQPASGSWGDFIENPDLVSEARFLHRIVILAHSAIVGGSLLLTVLYLSRQGKLDSSKPIKPMDGNHAT